MTVFFLDIYLHLFQYRQEYRHIALLSLYFTTPYWTLFSPKAKPRKAFRTLRDFLKQSLGAEGETRTPTPLPELDPEPSVSTNSTTSARKVKYRITIFLASFFLGERQTSTGLEKYQYHPSYQQFSPVSSWACLSNPQQSVHDLPFFLHEPY